MKNAQQIPFDIDSLRRPYLMEYFDGYLYFAELNSDELISVFNASTGKFHNRTITKGLGPNDYIWITSIGVQNNKMMVYDGGNQKIGFFSNLQQQATQEKKDTSIKLHTDSIFTTAFKAFALSDSSYIVSGIIKNAHWGIIDSKGYLKNTFERFPEDPSLTRKLKDHEASMAYQGKFIINPQKTKAVSIYSCGTIIRFYDIPNTGVPIRTKEYIYNYPQYKDNGDKDVKSIVFAEDNITSFVDVKGSPKYCFMLYSGLSAQEAGKGRDTWYSGKEILIYDWEGNPDRIIKLADRYKMIAVNSEKRLLYLFKENTIESVDDYSISIIDLSTEYESF